MDRLEAAITELMLAIDELRMSNVFKAEAHIEEAQHHILHALPTWTDEVETGGEGG